jgi:hypothetical protein
MANVGRLGHSASKKWTGKFDVMPPSDSQQRMGFGCSGSLASSAQSGTAEMRPGKLRLTRAATTTGMCSASGKTNSGRWSSVTGSPSLSTAGWA